jgi:hypothetical protein
MTLLGAMVLVAVVALALALTVDRRIIGVVPATLLVLVVWSIRRGERPLSLPARVGLTCGVLVVPFLVAILASKALWGYYLEVPPVDRRLAEASRVRSLSFVRTVEYSSGAVNLVFGPIPSIPQAIEVGRNDTFQKWVTRPLVALKERGRLPDDVKSTRPGPSMDPYDDLVKTGWLASGATGYVKGKDLRGMVIEADGAGGSPLVFVAVHGGEVAEGRYPYYEFLFSGRLAEGPLQLVSARRFFFDIGPMGGFHWPEMFAAAATVELFLLALAVYAVQHLPVKAKAAPAPVSPE